MRRLHLPIQNPCHEDWTAMESDGASRRFCDLCTKHVHDVSAMTEPAARAVLTRESAKGRVCVRYTLDSAGQIKFKPETVEAPSMWRTTLAAASMAMALMTGCADPEPDRILADKCVYELGPWSFSADRGQGTCPDVEPEPEDLVMGEVTAVIDPPPEPALHEVKGDIGPIEQPQPPPEHQRMGKMAVDPAPEPEIEAIAPCDPPREGPRRI